VANSFDVIVLGGGPAGYVCAIRCAQLGLPAAVIEQEKLGGVCVNIGCIPTKALLHSAYIAHLLKDSKDFGVEAGSVKTDYGTAMKRSRRVAEQNSKGVDRSVSSSTRRPSFRPTKPSSWSASRKRWRSSAPAPSAWSSPISSPRSV
jgi:pyruvate/2-oxoglutarate dehydrogenase complex dihydrolipoamide dehydrogenase (E3) component